MLLFLLELYFFLLMGSKVLCQLRSFLLHNLRKLFNFASKTARKRHIIHSHIHRIAQHGLRTVLGGSRSL